MIVRRHKQHQAGFTLLEVMLAVLLLGVIIGMVFGIAKTSLSLSQAIVQNQNQEMEKQAFYDLLGQRFSSMPGNARIDLSFEESGNRYLSDLTIQNVPMSFTWGGEERIAKAVQLSTVKRRSGFLDIVLRYYEDEILEGAEATVGESSLDDAEPFAEIVLLSDVAYFEWQVLNSSTMEWQYEWDDSGRLPLQLELLMSIGVTGEEMRHVFWIAPKTNPEIVMRQMGQGGDSNLAPIQLPPSIEVEVPSPGGGQ